MVRLIQISYDFVTAEIPERTIINKGICNSSTIKLI